MISPKKAFIITVIAMFGVNLHAQRMMENLGRGLIAVKTDSGYFLSWRFLGTEYASGKNYSFDIYKGSVKLNQLPITNATCFNDNSPGKGDYSVHTLVDGKEQQVSKAMMVEDESINIPLKPGNYYTHFVWPGDLDAFVCLISSS
jgi:rhamnogalacturonan endolyase